MPGSSLKHEHPPRSLLAYLGKDPLDLPLPLTEMPDKVIDAASKNALSASIERALRLYELDPKLAKGLTQYVLRFNLYPKRSSAESIMELVTALAPMQGESIRHAISFAYPTTPEDPLKHAARNASLLINTFGPDFFAERERQQHFKAPFGEGDYYLAVSGGSGASTFSLDFAIGSERSGGLSGQLWRMGVDFAYDDTKLIMRIIRSGSAVRNDPLKREAFSKFTRRYKTTPQRTLGFLLLQIAYDMYANEVTVLSTTGAKNLSTLGRTKKGADYTTLFSEMGFQGSGDANWLHIPNYTSMFWGTQFSIQSPPYGADGMLRHETLPVSDVYAAFHNLQDYSGSPFPLPIPPRVDAKTNALLLLSTLARNDSGYCASIPLPPQGIGLTSIKAGLLS